MAGSIPSYPTPGPSTGEGWPITAAPSSPSLSDLLNGLQQPQMPPQPMGALQAILTRNYNPTRTYSHWQGPMARGPRPSNTPNPYPKTYL